MWVKHCLAIALYANKRNCARRTTLFYNSSSELLHNFILIFLACYVKHSNTASI
uniref:Uncharacterized protein n=1 Tax=Arundo donax TaxID=35708 RepID=A0A0A9CSC6_ARUDO